MPATMGAKDSPSPKPSASAIRIVRCPTCGKSVEWTPESRYRPFCSKRCKMIDLGAWASEAYRVPVVKQNDEDAPEEDDGASGAGGDPQTD